MLFRSASSYVDDIAVYSKTWEQHLLDVEEILKLFIKSGIKLRSEKCEFGSDQTDFLGFRISSDGLTPIPSKIWPLKTYPVPNTVAKVRSFNGMANFYKRFIKGFAQIMKPLYALTKETTAFKWTPQCDSAFEQIKQAIAENAVLQFPDYDKEFHVFTDASNIGVGAVLTQMDKNGFYRPIEFIGRLLNKAEENYTVTDKEMLGVIFGIKKIGRASCRERV